jgi:putative FmdB family regulatory protein
MSKLILYDFECPQCGAITEDMVKSDVRQTPCPECGSAANRLISTPRFDPRMGLDPEGNPTMAARWAKVRKDRAKLEARHHKEHGTDMTPGADTSG